MDAERTRLSYRFTPAPQDAHERITDPLAFCVYMAIKRYEEWGTGANCFPSIQRIADTAHVSRTCAVAKIRLLEEEGWIKRFKRGTKDGDQDTNLYVVRNTLGQPGGSAPDVPPPYATATRVVRQPTDGGAPDDHEQETGNEIHHPDTSTEIQRDVYAAESVEVSQKMAKVDDWSRMTGYNSEDAFLVTSCFDSKQELSDYTTWYLARTDDPNWKGFTSSRSIVAFQQSRGYIVT